VAPGWSVAAMARSRDGLLCPSPGEGAPVPHQGFVRRGSKSVQEGSCLRRVRTLLSKPLSHSVVFSPGRRTKAVVPSGSIAARAHPITCRPFQFLPCEVRRVTLGLRNTRQPCLARNPGSCCSSVSLRNRRATATDRDTKQRQPQIQRNVRERRASQPARAPNSIRPKSAPIIYLENPAFDSLPLSRPSIFLVISSSYSFFLGPLFFFSRLRCLQFPGKNSGSRRSARFDPVELRFRGLIYSVGYPHLLSVTPHARLLFFPNFLLCALPSRSVLFGHP